MLSEHDPSHLITLVIAAISNVHKFKSLFLTKFRCDGNKRAAVAVAVAVAAPASLGQPKFHYETRYPGRIPCLYLAAHRIDHYWCYLYFLSFTEPKIPL